MKKFPDEDEIEAKLKVINDFSLGETESINIIEDLRWLLKKWEKRIGSRLTNYVEQNFMSNLGSTLRDGELEESQNICKKINVLLSFFQHLIYAIDEFTNRKFRNSVLRCGLICERLVNMLAQITGNKDLISGMKFIDRSNKIKKYLEQESIGEHEDRLRLFAAFEYIYIKRDKRAAHDTDVADIILAKSCVSDIPGLYKIYLDIVEKIMGSIPSKDELLSTINSILNIQTNIVTESPSGGIPKTDDLIVVLYTNGVFKKGKSVPEVLTALESIGHRIPRTTLKDGLERANKKYKFLHKDGKKYFERLPPTEYYKGQITE